MIDVCMDKVNIIRGWNHYLMLCKHSLWSVLPSSQKFYLTNFRQSYKSSHGKWGHTFLSGKNHCFICLTIRSLIFFFLSHWEILDFQGEEFALRGSIYQTVPWTKRLSALFLLSLQEVPAVLKQEFHPLSREELLLLVAGLRAGPGLIKK